MSPLVRSLLVAGALASALPAVGCASSFAARDGTTARVVASAPEAEAAPRRDEVAQRLRAAEEESDLRARRIRELESRLALRDAEVRDLQEEVDAQASEAARELASARAQARVQTVQVDEVAPEPAEPREEEPRVVLRLYGPPTPPPLPEVESIASTPGAMRAPLYLPAPPPASMGRLPVLATSSGPVPPIPDQPIYVAPNPAPAPVRPEVDLAVREYQAALQLVTSRRFQEADAALMQFLRAHPDHPYADNAMYWRAETLYARRDYAAAERELSEMVRRFPQGNKVPDALLRLGFCRQRQGDPEGARQYFRRVVAGYPGSVAARLASREDT